MDLITCATNSHVPRAEDVIRFVKKRLKAIESETPFKKYRKRLTIKMTKYVIVLINLLRRESGVHSVLSSRQILLVKKLKTPLCKIEDLVMAWDVKANNKTSRPRVFYALYIGPNNSGTSHSVFKLLTK